MEEHLVTRKDLAVRKCSITKREDKSCATKKKRKVSEFLPDEFYEEILVRLDVEDLIRCKSVCKSWKSLISQRHFIKAHKDYCSNNNSNNNRQTMIGQAAVVPLLALNRPDQPYFLVGSANGLVCLHNTYCDTEFIVANPWTREENMVQQPLASNLSCRGFGYDPVTNDYKIVFGVPEKGMNQTSFQVLSLKSNVWKHTGHVNGICPHGQIATLCNGALHWFMHHEGDEGKSSIISFDLSKDVFTEIPQPDDARYGHNKDRISGIRSPMMLGIKDECLCISYRDLDDNSNLWIMRKYNVKESWVKWGSNYEFKYEALDLDRLFNGKGEVENDVSDTGRSTLDPWFLKKCMCVPAITVLQSLISPHPSRQ